MSSRQIRNYLALASLLFFAPLVRWLLREDKLPLSDEDKTFIESYMWRGYITIALTIIVLAIGLLSLFMDFTILTLIYGRWLYVIIASIVAWVIGIIANRTLIKWPIKLFVNEEMNHDKGNMFVSYLPWYNIFLRYSLKKFDKPYWRAKESLIRRWVITIVSVIFQNELAAIFMVLLLITRIVTLLSGIDIISKKHKDTWNHLFHTNPEEIRAYITGTFSYLFHKMKHDPNISLLEIINNHKKPYQQLYSFDHNATLILEYILWITLLVMISMWPISLYIKWVTSVMFFVGLLVLLSRYIMMWVRNTFPLIPLFHEISTLLIHVVHSITKHFIKSK